MSTYLGLSKLKISTRLAAGFAIFFALLIMLVGLGVARVNQINEKLIEMEEVNSVKQRHAINFRGSVHDRAIALRDAAIEPTAAGVAERVKLIEELAEKYAASAKPLEELLAKESDEAERQALARIKEVESKALPIGRALVALKQEGKAEEAMAMALSQARPAYEEWLKAINALIDLEEAKNKKAAEAAREIGSGFQTIMGAAAALAVALGALIGFLLNASIVAPLARLKEAASRAQKESDFTVELGDGGSDDIGSTEGSLKLLLGSLRESFAGITRSVAQAQAASRASLSNAEAVEAASLEQRQSSAGMAFEVETLSASIEQAAGRAKEAKLVARESQELARLGDQEIEKMLASVQQRMGLSVESATRIRELNQSARQVSDVMGAIASIAEQTNLLALNAAIEAARAGESGRGFAVVADEVRKLAEKTKQATLDISATLGSMGSLSASVLEGSVELAEASKRDHEQAERFRKSVAQIGEASRRAAEEVERISLALDEQSEASKTVARQVDQVAQSAEANGERSIQAKAMAAELEGLTARVAELVGRYKA